MAKEKFDEADCKKYIGIKGESKVAHMPLEKDSLRRFVQAIMDTDPLYFDEEYAKSTFFGNIVATPLYPVHAFRTPADGSDRLNALQTDPDLDGTDSMSGAYSSLPKIESPFKRLLNGGNEITFYRALEIGEVCVSTPKYKNVELKNGKSGPMLLVTIETEYKTQSDKLLLINTQTLIWR